MTSDLQTFISEVFQHRFAQEFVRVKVNFTVPHHAFVQVRVKQVRSEMIDVAQALEQEFAELDKWVSVQVVEDGKFWKKVEMLRR